MLRSRTRTCVCTLVLVCGMAAAQDCGVAAGCATMAHSAPGPRLDFPEPALVRLEVEEVRLTVSVSDGNGRPVTGLTAQDFLVRDNDRLVAVRSSADASDVPLQVGLLVDWSGSVEKLFDFQRRSATGFLTRVLRREADEGFVVDFADHAVMAQAPTRDAAKLRSAVYPMKPNLTALYDAIVVACDLHGKQLSGGAVRRAVLLLSDGNDTDSYHTLQDAIDAAQRSDTAVYAITMHRRGRVQGDYVLQRMAEMTGGEAFVVSRESQLIQAFEAIERDLRSGYLLSYKPQDLVHDGRYHELVVASRDPALRARARGGYFAPRP